MTSTLISNESLNPETDISQVCEYFFFLKLLTYYKCSYVIETLEGPSYCLQYDVNCDVWSHSQNEAENGGRQVGDDRGRPPTRPV